MNRFAKLTSLILVLAILVSIITCVPLSVSAAEHDLVTVSSIEQLGDISVCGNGGTVSGAAGTDNWLNGSFWDPSEKSNVMTEIRENVYSISFDDLPALSNYQFKFLSNYDWYTCNWGENGNDMGDPTYYQGTGVESDARFFGSNILFAIANDNSIVEIRLDLTDFDLSVLNKYTKNVSCGSKYTVNIFNSDGTPVSGYCGEESGDYQYVLSGDDAVITKYKGNATRVTVPDSIDGHNVVEIGGGAFANNSSINEIGIPEGVTYISVCAFYNCPSLIKVTLPESMVRIASKAFANCSNLEFVNLSDNVCSLDNDTFLECSNLKIKCIPSSYSYNYATEHNIPMTGIKNYSMVLEGVDGEKITTGYTVNWYEKDSDVIIGNGSVIYGLDDEKEYQYEIILEEALSQVYRQPVRQDVTVQENEQMTVVLEKLGSFRASGQVTNSNNQPIANATIEFRQVFNGRYKKIVKTESNRDGVFSTELSEASTTAVISAPGFYRSTVVVAVGGNISDTAEIGTIALTKLPENKIMLSLTKINATLSGQEKPVTQITSANGLAFSLFNNTQNKAIIGFTVQYPYIFFDDSEVNGADSITLKIADENNEYRSGQQTVKLDEQKTGTCTMSLIENGKFTAPVIFGNERNTVMLFDESGNFVLAENVGNDYTSDSLTEGNYQAVFIKKTDLLRSVSSISKLSEFGLSENTDYIVRNIHIVPGEIEDIGSVEVPMLDDSKLYYTVADNTAFTADSTMPYIGKYIVMRCSYEIDEKYTCQNEVIQIELPAGVNFVNGSLALNGKICAYHKNNQMIEVQTNQRKGIVRFYAVATDKGRKNINATLSFNFAGSVITQPVGTATFSATAGIISVPEKTGQTEVTASGTTLADSIVTVYDNGVEVGTTESSKAGRWHLSFDLVKPYSFSHHEIFAKITNSHIEGTVATDTQTLFYDKQYYEVSKVTMINTDHMGRASSSREYRTEFDFIHSSAVVPSYNYWPTYPTFTFMVEFTGGDETVFSGVKVVTTDSAGYKTYVPCDYDSSTGLWIGTHDYVSFSEVPVSVGVKFNEVYSGYEISKEDAFEMMKDGVFNHTDSKDVEVIDIDNNKYSIDGEDVRLSCSNDYLENFIPGDTYELIDLDGFQYWSKINVVEDSASMTIVMPIDSAKEYSEMMEDEAIEKLIAGKSNGFIKLGLEIEILGDKESIAETGAQTGCQIESDCWIERHRDDTTRDQFTSQHWNDVLHEHDRLEALSDCVPEDLIEDIHGRLNNLAQQYFDAVQFIDNANTIFEWLGRAAHRAEWTQAEYFAESAQAVLVFTGLTFDVGFYSAMAGIARQISGLKNVTCPDDDGSDDQPTKPIIDPSGYVYEAVPSNRIEGVKVEAFYYDYAVDEFGVPEDEKSDILWDAENYDQVNPLYTDSNGEYAWDVPVGQWLVKFSKDGYYDTDSKLLNMVDDDGYLPVPPPQTEVNVGMVSKDSPTVDEISAFDNEIRIVFSQYMKLDSVNNKTVTVQMNGKAIEGTVTPLNAEYDYENVNQYASKFSFVPKTSLTGNVNVTVNGAINYAGTKMKNTFTHTGQVNVMPESISADSKITVTYNSGALLEVDILPKEAGVGLTVSAVSSSPSIVDVVNSSVVTDANGHANIMLEGKLPGQGEITLSVSGTDLTQTVLANVSGVVSVNDRCEKVTASIASGSTVEAGTLLELSTTTEGADIYYTLDGSCPCSAESPSRIKYTEPIRVDENTFVIAYAVKDGMQDSYTAGFNYFVPIPVVDLLLGDVDSDDGVSIVDATYIQRHLASIPIPFVLNETIADTDEDGIVSIMDATYIQRWLAQLQSNDNIGKPIS